MIKKQNTIPRLSPGLKFIDTHCHLDMDAYRNDLAGTIKSAELNGVKGIITVGIDLESSIRAIELARQNEGVWATVGVHPHNADSGNLSAILKKFEKLVDDTSNKIVGYGEIGLDYAKNYAPHAIQASCFKAQLAVAKQLNLPIVIHDRDAHDTVMKVLHDHAPYPAGGVMHCFSGDIELAKQVIDLGLLISIPGIVTFKNASVMQLVAKEIPLTSMILETDGPFLAPVPYRGKVNRPEYLPYSAEKIARLRKISLDEVAHQTTLNAEQLFRLKGSRLSA